MNKETEHSAPQENLAVRANLESVKYAMAKDREAWLALFDEDALVCDPVGKSPLDPLGCGHKGKQAIASFFDNVIAPASTSMTIGKHRIAGEFSCAVPMQATNQLTGDVGENVSLTVDMITAYTVNQQGLIVSLQAYWDWSALETKMAELFNF